MTVSTPNQTTLERPWIQAGVLCVPSAPSVEVGDPPLKIFAKRNGDRVTGRVEFPYQTNGHRSCPIDYRNQSPERQRGVAPSDEATKRRSDEDPNPQSAIRNPHSTRRLDAVLYYRQLRTEQSSATASTLLEQTRQAFRRRFSVSSLRGWNDKYELQGEAGLADRYTPRPRKVLSLDARQATRAVTICAWWAFRIGNVKVIDTKIMHVAASSFILHPSSFSVADVLATIDGYYSYGCDRNKYPFKPFPRWAKYDFQKWLMRACEDGDYRRGAAAEARMRKREVQAKGNRQAIRGMAVKPENVETSKPQNSGSDSPIRNPQSQIPNWGRFGLRGLGRDMTAAAAPGIPALCTNNDPKTVAEALATLNDSYRSMLLAAARGDPGCRQEAVATLPMWWDAMPQALRESIDLKIETWRREHPRATDAAAADRKVRMFLPELRKRSSFTRLSPAARILR